MTENISVPELVPDTFDLDKWIDGTCGLTKIATVYQRGDLFAEVEKLQKELAKAEKISKDQRGVGDRAPEQVEEEWAAAAQKLTDSAILLHVQDRTEERRRKIRGDLAKTMKVDLDKLNADDDETITLHVIADAIVKVETPDGKVKDLPDGFPPNRLRDLKDRLGDAGIYDLIETYRRVTMEAPLVAAPLSRRSSSDRGGIT